MDKEIINKIKVFDIYKGKNIPDQKKSIALSVEIIPQDKTLTDREIDSLCERIISEVSIKLNGHIRQE